MNKFIIKKGSISNLIELVIEKNKDIRLFRKLYLNKVHNIPIKFNYASTNSINLKIDIEVRFGVDILKNLEKISNEIKSNLEKLARVSVKSVELIVKGVFNEEKIKESAEGN